MNLTELELIFNVVSELRTQLSYHEFEDLVYDMRHINYKMIGILEKGKLITYAGVNIQTNLYHRRHLYIFDLVTTKKYRERGYGKMMLEYLKDYAKMGMCENIVLSSGFEKKQAHKFYKTNNFVKKSFMFVKSL